MHVQNDETKSELSFSTIHSTAQAPVFIHTGLIIYLNTVSLPHKEESKRAVLIGGKSHVFERDDP